MNNDLIYRQTAIDDIKGMPNCPNGYSDTYDKEHIIAVLEEVPSAQPTLYGYKIEHLAYIAKVMEKEGVTAEYATKTFEDISRAVRMIIEEAQQKVEEMLNECRPPRPYKEEE